MTTVHYGENLLRASTLILVCLAACTLFWSLFFNITVALLLAVPEVVALTLYFYYYSSSITFDANGITVCRRGTFDVSRQFFSWDDISCIHTATVEHSLMRFWWYTRYLVIEFSGNRYPAGGMVINLAPFVASTRHLRRRLACFPKFDTEKSAACTANLLLESWGPILLAAIGLAIYIAFDISSSR